MIFLAVLVAQLSAHNYDPSYFIAIGDRYIRQPEDLPRNVQVLPDSAGYDGQFYYQLALDPFAPQAVNAGLSISNGPYRHQRIIYPLLVWLFSFGNPALAPAMLLLVNYLALCLIAWLGARYAQIHRRHALWGLLFPLYPGFLFTLTRDLTEIVAVLFLLAAMVALYRSSSPLLSTLFLTLALLTRETALLAALAAGIGLIIERTTTPRQWARLLPVAMPLGVYGIWQAALWEKWGVPPVLAGSQNVGLSGQGLLSFIRTLQIGDPLHRIWIVELAFLALIAGAALYALRTTRLPLSHKLPWLGYALLVLSLTRRVWVEDIAFMRAAAEFYLFSLILIIPALRLSLLAIVATGTAVTWRIVYSIRLDW